VIEIQVKRSITFSPTDTTFQKVVDQIIKASQKPEFNTIRYELAIARAQTARQIEGACQDVLRWTREIGDAASFIARIKRPGSASDSVLSWKHSNQT